VQLTPDEQRQAERRLLAAQAHVSAGSVDRADDLLVQAIEVLHDPLSTAQAIGLKGRIQFHIGHVAEAASALVEAAHRLRPLDPRAAAEALLSALAAIVFRRLGLQHLPPARDR
jgi:hypothetical protein